MAGGRLHADVPGPDGLVIREPRPRLAGETLSVVGFHRARCGSTTFPGVASYGGAPGELLPDGDHGGAPTVRDIRPIAC